MAMPMRQAGRKSASTPTNKIWIEGGRMLPINDFIFSNPDWASIPIQTVLGVLMVGLFLLSFRYGPKGAIDVVSRFRWLFVAALVLTTVWGLYAYSVLQPASRWAH